MDLESELREAMAEHTAEASAPASLAAAVRHRHRRRVARIRTTVGIAAVAVVAIAAVPSYRSMNAGPVSSSRTPTSTGAAAVPPGPEKPPASGPARPPHSTDGPGAGSSRQPTAPGTTPGRNGGPLPTAGGRPAPPAWVTYLPSGLSAAGPCRTERSGRETSTTCRWRGASGSVEVRVVRGMGLDGPESLATFPGVPKPTTVRGRRAVMSDRPDSGRQVAWLDRPGVGVLVVAGGAARDRLLQIAEGVRL
ncbi:hypothetical protein [Actinomadura rudentiformis]|uniref:DUF2020 domain-containing protein n=1 Tax=Actinomadura rudentiformis TaxID=359158 RepID=A0A6H9YRB0_9ACTN|nr:hypothetical protein [Actinomadura rudentiformis]KAB2350662.1 hypothetical protein F8566_06600 [Actinomadura rudentiformis]